MHSHSHCGGSNPGFDSMHTRCTVAMLPLMGQLAACRRLLRRNCLQNMVTTCILYSWDHGMRCKSSLGVVCLVVSSTGLLVASQVLQYLTQRYVVLFARAVQGLLLLSILNVIPCFQCYDQPSQPSSSCSPGSWLDREEAHLKHGCIWDGGWTCTHPNKDVMDILP